MKNSVSGSFDDLRSRHIRHLQEAAKRGDLHVQIWSDALFEKINGRSPRFPQAERRYFVEAIRFVTSAEIVNDAESAADIDLSDQSLKEFPQEIPPSIKATGRKK